jgi:hypothetical protein
VTGDVRFATVVCAHVPREFGIPVIGVAGTAYRAGVHVIPVLRGKASRPPHVTADGVDLPTVGGP